MEIKQKDTKITVGSLVELIREDFTDIASRAAWKIGDIARVIEMDGSSIPYRIRIGKYTSWCNANEVKLYVPKETVSAEEVLPQLKYKVGDTLKVLTDRRDLAEWCTYGAIVSIHRVDDTDSSLPYLVDQLESTSIDERDFVWLSQNDAELYVPEVEEVFKTQQEIWKYLSESDEHSVTDGKDTIVHFKNGSLSSCLSFTIPENWKPFTPPKPKEWWELVPEGTEVLCWYGDILSEKTGKPPLFGKVYHSNDRFTTGSCLTWKYAIPVTLEEIKQYILSEILTCV